MKKLLLLIGVLSLISCGSGGGKKIKDSDIVHYKSELGDFTLQAHIGDDLQSALDSLLRLKTDLPDTQYVVATEPLNVGWVLATGHCFGGEGSKTCVNRYKNEDRSFYIVAFKHPDKATYLFPPADIIDNQGNWYLLTPKSPDC